ncbi:MSHA biogenesis protein MshQ [Gammaproteobacteria bacterium]
MNHGQKRNMWKIYLVHFILVWGLVLGSKPTRALTATASPILCANLTGIGTALWSNPSRALVSDNSYATAQVNNTTTNYLKCTSYGFSIPTGAIINGITVKVERSVDRTDRGNTRDAVMRLVKAGVIGATDRSTTTVYTASDIVESHGGVTDLWGTTWTPADINNTNFGAVFSAAKGSGGNVNVKVDYIQIVVDYTVIPIVTTINRTSTNPTTANTAVSWSVVFSISVSGVDSTDFVLVPTAGMTGTTITAVSGSGATWTVTANTGSGGGTLGLNLVDNDSIVAASIPLGGAGTGNGTFTGQLYTVPPTVSSINLVSTNPTNPATSVAWTVTFLGSVTGVDVSDFSLIQANGVSGASITGVTGSGTTWTVTANTGTGSGTLGLNLIDNDSIVAGGIPLGGTGTGNGNFTGQVYSVTIPFSCSAPTGAPAGLTCLCDTFGRASLNPSSISGGNWALSNSDGTGVLPSIVIPGYLRLTGNGLNNAKAATVPGIFPAAGNYISVEFQHFAYNGTGADGIAVTLSDFSIPAVPGAYGGSLGYAQRTGVDGFAGGWIGVALDEYGNYQNPTEGRLGGAGFIVQSVGARGSGSGSSGYRWIGGTSSLTPTIDNHTATTPSSGHYYQIIVDARNYPTSTAVAVNRNTGSGYASLINIPNIYSTATSLGFTQAPVPTNWQISFTGASGSYTNIHEIGGLRICAQYSVPVSGGTADGFNAIDDAYGTPPLAVQNYLSGHIYTKVTGIPFALNVAALTNSQIQTTYAISGNKTVTVKLVDNSDSISDSSLDCTFSCTPTCLAKPAVSGGTQTLTFTASNNGQKQSSNFTINTAYQKLVAIISDGTTNACSTDAFSVRPQNLMTVTALTSGGVAMASTSSGSTGTPTIKAGANFTLSADTATVGYAGVPKILASGVSDYLGSTTANLLVGSFGAANSSTGKATSTTFRYDDVGYFILAANAIYDGVYTTNECTTPGLTIAQCDALKSITWTGVDSISAKADCIPDNNTNVKTNGKYGCNIGSNGTSWGRFIPARLEVSGNALFNSQCNGGVDFTYFGQDFGFSSDPTITITGMNAASVVTKNYDSAFWRLNTSFTNRIYTKNSSLTTAATLTKTAAGNIVISDQNNQDGDRVYTISGERLTFSKPNVPESPIVATSLLVDLTIPVGDLTDSDGVCYEGLSTFGTCKAFTLSGIQGTELRYGRLWMGNGYGSDQTNITIPYETQYWNGYAFVRNMEDNCTILTAANFGLGNYQGSVTLSNLPTTAMIPDSFSQGSGSITLLAPHAAGSVDIVAKLANSLSMCPTWTPPPVYPVSPLAFVAPYLHGQWCGSTYSFDPVVRATFGIFGSSLRANGLIYLREDY